jgi:hypothetical protein
MAPGSVFVLQMRIRFQDIQINADTCGICETRIWNTAVKNLTIDCLGVSQRIPPGRTLVDPDTGHKK